MNKISTSADPTNKQEESVSTMYGLDPRSADCDGKHALLMTICMYCTAVVASVVRNATTILVFVCCCLHLTLRPMGLNVPL